MQAVDLAEAQHAAAAKGGYDPAFDVKRTFLHDVPREVVEDLMAHGEPPQADEIFSRQFPLASWPDASTRVIACTEDRMFPLPLVERITQERIGVQAEHLRSGHLPAFGHPHQLAELLLAKGR